MEAAASIPDAEKPLKSVGPEVISIRFRNWILAVKPHGKWLPALKPLAWGTVAAVLAAASKQSVEAQTGLSMFAVLTLSKSAWEALHRLRAKPEKRLRAGRKAWQVRKPRRQDVINRLQLDLKAVRRQASEAIMEAETLRLERDHLEARCQRAESLREQLHASFTSVLSRLQRCESDEAHLRQEILRMTALAVPGSATLERTQTGALGLALDEAAPGFTYAPSTPTSSRNFGNGKVSNSMQGCKDDAALRSPAGSSQESFEDEETDEDPEAMMAEDGMMSDVTTDEMEEARQQSSKKVSQGVL
mmetsp:Transcript_66801/g.118261  ORF Transcript_66801/g.118261 Transcript_66801/m.118261 type:complete len:303 (-) Transcript_66801:125-1033(-)